MVEEMGGRIEVVSHLGDGATFTVLLPAVASEARLAGQATASPSPPPATAAARIYGPGENDLTVSGSKS
jgi:hypothetical protein